MNEIKKRYKFQEVAKLDLEFESLIKQLNIKFELIDEAIKNIPQGGGNGYIELRVDSGYIQWRNDPNGSWNNLVSLASLQGAQGNPGVGVPTGGTTGQVLKKNSNADYDTVWNDDSLQDGNKGDVTVSNSGLVFTINTDAVTETKIKDNEVTESKLKLSDNTIGDVSTARHGLMPKLPNDANKFLNGIGQWVTISMISAASPLLVLGIDDIGLQVINFVAGNPFIIT